MKNVPKTFSVSRKIDVNRKITVKLQTPLHIPTAGDWYRVKRFFSTHGGEVYSPGDILIIIGRTRKDPYNSYCSLGNLKVRGKNGKITIWSNIEWMITENTLELVLL